MIVEAFVKISSVSVAGFIVNIETSNNGRGTRTAYTSLTVVSASNNKAAIPVCTPASSITTPANARYSFFLLQ